MIPNPEQTLASCTINATNITSKPGTVYVCKCEYHTNFSDVPIQLF